MLLTIARFLPLLESGNFFLAFFKSFILFFLPLIIDFVEFSVYTKTLIFIYSNMPSHSYIALGFAVLIKKVFLTPILYMFFRFVYI